MQNVGLKRDQTDKFYTKKEIAELCINIVKKNIIIEKDNLIIEPSAGNGAFIESIKTIQANYIFYDIEPENSEIIKQDYLSLEPKKIHENIDIHTIGNPPFGRQSSSAIKFIKKSCEFSKSISFILPRSFKKPSFQKHIPIKYHLIYQFDIPKNSFTVNGDDYDVPCVFQIWELKDTPREVKEKLEPLGYSFVKKNDNPTISFRRVGVYAGKVSNEISDKSEQSHYFIKLNHETDISNIIEKLNSIKYDCASNTVGPKSISKQELIEQFNNIL